MSTPRQILAAIFDMDGLLIDSEPLWDRAELDVMASLGVISAAVMNFPIRWACASIWWLTFGMPTSRGWPQSR
jgi:phosphoglycolate phosphatase-like HAD superfamily hydrolase